MSPVITLPVYVKCGVIIGNTACIPFELSAYGMLCNRNHGTGNCTLYIVYRPVAGNVQDSCKFPLFAHLNDTTTFLLGYSQLPIL